MIKPTVFGQAIILLAFAPLLMFTGVEGKTFSPMAITIMLALVAAFVLAITLVPPLVALLIRGHVAEKEVWLIRQSRTQERRVGKGCVSTCSSRWAPYT